MGGVRVSLQVHLRQEPVATTTRRPRLVRQECRNPPRILGSIHTQLGPGKV